MQLPPDLHDLSSRIWCMHTKPAINILSQFIKKVKFASCIVKNSKQIPEKSVSEKRKKHKCIN